MMIKVLFYAYMRNIYSCRNIEAKIGNIIRQIEKGIQDDNRGSDETPTRINPKELKEKVKDLNANEKQSREQKRQIKKLDN